MRTNTQLKNLLAALTAAFTFVGCSQNGDLPETVDAGGIVTFNEDPLPGAIVMFRKTGGRPANAVTGPDGRFTLSTFADMDGAVPGEYIVTVTKKLKANSGNAGSDPSQGDSMEAAAAAAERQESNPSAPLEDSLIPTRYANPETSQLTYTVSESGGENDFKIELTD